MHLLSQYPSSSYETKSMSAPNGIQGQLLEVTVVGCNKLKDTEWISRQDPYVCLEYAHTKVRTRTCTDGGKNPTFQEKFVFSLIDGLRELNVVVWNSNTFTYDDFIGSGKVQLQRVLSQGYDDTPWPLQSKSGRYAGDVRLVMHFAGASRTARSSAASAPPYVAPAASPVSQYAQPPPATYYPATTAYPAASPYSSYPPPANLAGYPPSAYSPHPQPTVYHPRPYPPQPYPPLPYPPSPRAGPFYPPSPYPGYPPPPY